MEVCYVSGSVVNEVAEMVERKMRRGGNEKVREEKGRKSTYAILLIHFRRLCLSMRSRSGRI